LPIVVGPAEAIPKHSFLRLRGLPPAALLTEGYAIAPGSWAIPLAGLPTLEISLPVGQSGKVDVTISLVSVEGTVLSEVRSSLVIAAAARAMNFAVLGPVEPTLPAPLPAARGQQPPSPVRPQLRPDDRGQALRLLGRGNDKLAQGNVSAARVLYQRAAEAGLADAAFAFAATYDPDELVRIRTVGMQPDREMACRWYEQARELGATEAEIRLKRLSAN
jgi:hypothetical protein